MLAVQQQLLWPHASRFKCQLPKTQGRWGAVKALNYAIACDGSYGVSLVFALANPLCALSCLFSLDSSLHPPTPASPLFQCGQVQVTFPSPQ